jgi:signal transduction histidine kinase
MSLDAIANIRKHARILIVDDDPRNLMFLQRILERDGYAICICQTDPRKAISQFILSPPDLLLLDWHMEPFCGKQVLADLKQKVPQEKMPPVLVLTADDSAATKLDALQAGATDFLSKPFDQTEVLLRIRNLLHLRKLNLYFQDENQNLENKVRERTAQLEQSVASLEELQQQIIDQERLRALGTMASGIAHDFNNVLMIISGYSDMLLLRPEKLGDPDRVRSSLETIGTASRDAAEIVRRLREFSRPYNKEEENYLPVSLNKLVAEAVNLSLPKWRTQTQANGITIEMLTELDEAPPISGVASELREVLVNLIFNAVDAMPQGGRIVIRTGVREGQVYLDVEDAGTGMTEETRPRCLEPFYTTKGDRGTGLGLSITYGIIRRHGGVIRLHSELNQGTTFTLLLPMLEAAEKKAEEPRASAATQPLRVLVVDDQPDICHVLSRYLEQDAHTVVTAENGCVALEKFRAGNFDLVITDRAMPKMNGDQLASAIKEIKPFEPVILMTAFAEPKSPSRDVDILLNKPFSLGSLRTAIGKAVVAA